VDSPVPKAAHDAQEFMGAWISEQVDSIPTPPLTIYHYTNVGALLNIFRTKELWATNAVYTNDQTEILHSIVQLRRVVQEELGDRQEDPASDVMLRAADDFYTIVQVYLVCFCTDDDLLSQWRGYGQQGGYALGFDTTAMGPLLRNGRVHLMPVVYEPGEQDRRIRDLVKRWRSVFREIPAREDSNLVRRMGEFVFAQCFAMLAVAFKSYAFREEQEWRLVYRRQVVIADDGSGFEVSFRDRDAMVTPYVAISGDADDSASRLPIRRVMIGPTKYSQLAGFGLTQFLKSLGYTEKEITVDSSSVPLRT
jgi:hypothetical protein